MITYKELRWGDAFSYGPKNVLRLDANPLTQILGKNGHGKSTLGLLLEEVQFNTNSKKIKKAQVLNRYTKSKTYFIELDFRKDSDDYTISTSRSNSSGSVKFMRNSVDISSHTSTATYKTIEDTLGYNFTTFGQIVYQSSISSLEFLTATDTARKTFLIELLNLSGYTQASDVFKKLASDIAKSVTAEEAKVETLQSLLTRYEKEDLTLKTEYEEPVVPADIDGRIAHLRNSLANIDSTNKRISTNNTYKTILDGIVVTNVPAPKLSEDEITQLRVKLASLKNNLAAEQVVVRNASKTSSTCPTCKQAVDNSFVLSRAKEAAANVDQLFGNIKDTEAQISAYELSLRVYQASQKQLSEWEKYHALFDTTLDSTLLDKQNLEDSILDLQSQLSAAKAELARVQKLNKVAAEHNAKVSVIIEQLDSLRVELDTHKSILGNLQLEAANYQVLVKAFSATGLVAYKIECLVKDLEIITNRYLSELADGRFQLSFRIASADKLNVVITDNGNDIEITALSTGERARVNVSTLLAIRSLMQGLSNSRTNLLILDETVENLDAEGKEKLIEVLLKEESLNTFLISHGFSHPLLEKISVIKEHNISRIE